MRAFGAAIVSIAVARLWDNEAEANGFASAQLTRQPEINQNWPTDRLQFDRN